MPRPPLRPFFSGPALGAETFEKQSELAVAPSIEVSGSNPLGTVFGGLERTRDCGDDGLAGGSRRGNDAIGLDEESSLTESGKRSGAYGVVVLSGQSQMRISGDGQAF